MNSQRYEELKAYWRKEFEEAIASYNGMADSVHGREDAKLENWVLPLRTKIVDNLDLPCKDLKRFGRVFEWNNGVIAEDEIQAVIRSLARATVRTLLNMSPQPEIAEVDFRGLSDESHVTLEVECDNRVKVVLAVKRE